MLFKRSLRPYPLDESSLSIGRVKSFCKMYMCTCRLHRCEMVRELHFTHVEENKKALYKVCAAYLVACWPGIAVLKNIM